MAHKHHIGYLECLYPCRTFYKTVPLQVRVNVRVFSHRASCACGKWRWGDWVGSGRGLERFWQLGKWAWFPFLLAWAGRRPVTWGRPSVSLGFLDFGALQWSQSPMRYPFLNFPDGKSFAEAEFLFILLTHCSSSQAGVRGQGEASTFCDLLGS